MKTCSSNLMGGGGGHPGAKVDDEHEEGANQVDVARGLQ
jgi:hypothetical protein